jgi:hypothetical protein
MSDQEIIDQIMRADAIKAQVPQSGVSADAIFARLGSESRRNIAKPQRFYRSQRNLPPPEWFNQALIDLSGHSLTIGAFLQLAGRGDAGRPERCAVGKWLRDTGRHPVKHGGEQRFSI